MGPLDANTIDADGRWVTPGLIDVHSHLGVYPQPRRAGAQRRQRDDQSGNRQRLGRAQRLAAGPGLCRALAGGITILQVLPGSANLIGGRAVTLKNVYAHQLPAA